MNYIRRILLYFCLIAPLGAIGQYTSFDFKFSEWSGRYVTTIETHDSSFLILTIHAIFKINHRGKLQWSYDEIYNFTTDKFEFVDGSPILYSHIMSDEEGIYVFGGNFDGASTYYMHLDHHGKKLFDTVYLTTWLAEKPLFKISTMRLINNIFETNGEYYHNLKFNADSTDYEYDHICFSQIRITKQGEVNMSFQCIADSGNAIFGRIALNTPDSGYLYIIMTGPRFPFNWTSRNSRYYVARADSSMRVLWHKDLLPPDQLPDFNLNNSYRIDYVYGSDDTLFSHPPPMRNRVRRSKYGILEITFSAYQSVNRGEYYFIFDSEGNILRYQKKESPFKPAPNSYMQKNLLTRDDVYEMSYYDRDKQMIWSNLYPSFPLEAGGSIDELMTNSNGYITVYINGKIGWSIDDRVSKPYSYLLRHINVQGWDLGYDPDAWEDAMPIRAWFDVLGDLRVVEDMEGWDLRVLNTIGQQLHAVTIPNNGRMQLPPSITSGVYILGFKNPRNKKWQYIKLFKE